MTTHRKKNLVDLTNQYCDKGLGSTFGDNSISLELDNSRLTPEKMNLGSYKRYNNSYSRNNTSSFQKYIFRKG